MSEQWNPINDLMVLQDQMNRLFEDVSQRRARAEAKPQDDIERADCICDYADATFKSRPQFWGVRELQFEGFIFHAPDTRHVVQTQEWQNTFRAASRP